MPRTVILMSLLLPVLVTSLTRGAVSPQRVERLDHYLSSEAARFHLPGVAIAVVDGDEIVHVKAFGESVTKDSAFIIGSCSKTVTALAALLAFDEAGIDLDTPITTLLTSMTIHGEVRPPTLRQLLQHRSGLTRAQGFDVVPSLAEVEAHGFSLDLRFPAGGRFSYSNKNYSLLGVLIEKVTGQTFCEYVHERVFKRAGMMASSCGPVPLTHTAAPEYQYCFGFPLRVGQTNVPASRIPSGFLRCTAHDLARLQICLLHDGVIDGSQVFPAGLIRQMKTPSGEREYGYGMGLSKANLDDIGLILAHEGATPTSYTFHGALTEKGLGVVLLININLFDPFTDHGETFYENMLRILDGQEPVKSYPYRIWVRWALIPALVLTVWQAGVLLVRWRRAGWPLVWPTTPRQRISLVFQLVLPVGIWIVILRWVQVPFVAVLEHDPDLIWAVLFMTAVRMVTSVIKACAGEAVSPPRRRLAPNIDSSPAPSRPPK
jgi:CubicO group peptidase (beta-lactamase class C family)